MPVTLADPTGAILLLGHNEPISARRAQPGTRPSSIHRDPNLYYSNRLGYVLIAHGLIEWIAGRRKKREERSGLDLSEATGIMTKSVGTGVCLSLQRSIASRECKLLREQCFGSEKANKRDLLDTERQIDRLAPH